MSVSHVSPVTLKLRTDLSRVALERSFRSVSNALDASDAARQVVADSFPDLFESGGAGESLQLTVEHSDRLWTCSLDVAAFRAGCATISLKPSERYRELVSTVAGYLELDLIDIHGWPILSLAGDTASLTEPAGVGNDASRGGAA